MSKEIEKKENIEKKAVKKKKKKKKKVSKFKIFLKLINFISLMAFLFFVRIMYQKFSNISKENNKVVSENNTIIDNSIEQRQKDFFNGEKKEVQETIFTKKVAEKAEEEAQAEAELVAQKENAPNDTADVTTEKEEINTPYIDSTNTNEVSNKKIENNKETGNLIKVRLYGIDAPELKQDYGYASKEFLMKLIRGKTVRIEGNKNDRYGRLLGTVYYNNENINEKMVATGNAWWYEKYDKKNTKLKQLQENAKKNKLGLFAKKGYIAPWEFRKMKSNKK